MRQFINEKDIKFSSFLDSAFSGDYKAPYDINTSALIEFLTFGSVYGDKTFLNGIKKKTTHQPYSIHFDKGIVTEKQFIDNPLQERKNVSIDEAKENILDYFESLRKSLRNKKISIDLTGGIDSRLIAALLLQLEIPFDAVYSQISGGEQEQKIVERISNEFDITLKIISQPDEIITMRDIKDLIELGDGMWDPLRLRSLQITQSWRRKNQYDLAITGVGGELYKDFWWQQDFPFYQKNHSNLDRLVQMRMYPVLLPEEWFGKEMHTEAHNFISGFKSYLKLFVQDSNTQTYDQIYYHLRIKEQISVFSHASAEFLPVWSPLLEPELLMIGYNLKRRDRFFNRFHRAVISDFSNQLARIPTTDGEMTVSNNTTDMAKDLSRFTKQKSKRLIAHFKKKKDEVISNQQSETSFIRNEVSDVIIRCKELNLFSEEAPDDASEYPKILHGRLLTVGYLVNRIS